MLLALLMLWRITSLPFGRVLKGIREDEVATQALGKHVTRFKVLAFVTAGCIAAVGGSLYAHYITYIDPYSFTLEESVYILSLVIVGGAGTLRGSVVGALFLVALPEILRFLRLPDAVAAPLRQMLYGALLVLFMRFRPQGLLGEYLK